MTLNEQFDLENKYEYMRSMRDAWEREAEALRTAMHRWADRAHIAERELERVLDAATHIQTQTHAHIRKPAQGGAPMREPATLTPIHTLTPVEEVMDKPFREVLQELHQMLIEAKEDSPKETGTWEERRVREQARRIAQEADEVVDAQYSNRTTQGGSRKPRMILQPKR